MRRSVTALTLVLAIDALSAVPAAAGHLPLEGCSPSGDVCKSVRGSSFGSSIAFRANLPFAGPGAYRVIWRFVGGGRIGRALGFHVGERVTAGS